MHKTSYLVRRENTTNTMVKLFKSAAINVVGTRKPGNYISIIDVQMTLSWGGALESIH